MIFDLKVKENERSGPFSHNLPFGKGSRSCRACFNHRGIVRQYDIMLCRRCFVEYSADIGFKKFD